MPDLKDLQQMAKNGEVSKKLLEDEEFKNELKKVLKEENGAEVTDEQITEIIKNFETALQNEELLKEAELEGVSGGRVSKAKALKGVSAVLGATIGFASGRKFGEEKGGYLGQRAGGKLAGRLTNFKDDLEKYTLNVLKGSKIGLNIGYYGSELVGTGGGLAGGWLLGDYICKKFDIKD